MNNCSNFNANEKRNAASGLNALPSPWFTSQCIKPTAGCTTSQALGVAATGALRIPDQPKPPCITMGFCNVRRIHPHSPAHPQYLPKAIGACQGIPLQCREINLQAKGATNGSAHLSHSASKVSTTPKGGEHR